MRKLLIIVPAVALPAILAASVALGGGSDQRLDGDTTARPSSAADQRSSGPGTIWVVTRMVPGT